MSISTKILINKYSYDLHLARHDHVMHHNIYSWTLYQQMMAKLETFPAPIKNMILNQEYQFTTNYFKVSNIKYPEFIAGTPGFYGKPCIEAFCMGKPVKKPFNNNTDYIKPKLYFPVLFTLPLWEIPYICTLIRYIIYAITTCISPWLMPIVTIIEPLLQVYKIYKLYYKLKVIISVIEKNINYIKYFNIMIYVFFLLINYINLIKFYLILYNHTLFCYVYNILSFYINKFYIVMIPYTRFTFCWCCMIIFICVNILLRILINN